jgi:hypothetical protein
MIAQRTIDRVERMPALPSPYAMKDWRQHTRDYDAFVFDLDARGDFLPLAWRDRSRRNADRDMLGLYSYVGSRRQGREEHHEGINVIGTVLGSSLCDVDVRGAAGGDRAAMCGGYFNRANGQDVFLNSTNGRTGGSFWYELYPHLLATGLHHCHPDAGTLCADLMRSADRWCDAAESLRGPGGIPDFAWTSYDLAAMKPVFNGKWREPDAAAAVAWLLHQAWVMGGSARHLEAASGALAFLERFGKNPLYEVLMPFGAAAAARMDAERGMSHDVGRLLAWCFDGDSVCRQGWGIIADRWGEYDCHGLVGSLIDWGQYVVPHDASRMEENIRERGGYAFTMNTFAFASPLVPLVRYDPRYARAIGKWMLNAANAARLFYPDAHDAFHQSCSFWTADPKHLVAYEGLRREWDGRKPYATGDPIRFSWGAIDLGLYGSSHVGIFGGIVATTDVEGILALDCLATDFHHGPACPTRLIYNPHPEEKRVSVAPALPAARAGWKVYDAVAQRFLDAAGRGPSFTIPVPPDSAALAVFVPAEATVAVRNGRRYAGDAVIDWHAGGITE